MPKLSQINTFITIVKEKSFTQAAKKMFVSPAAISRKISNLEEELGTDLFQKNYKKAELTYAGSSYYNSCLEIVDKVEDATQAIELIKKTSKGNLSITCATAFGEKFIQPHLGEFIKRYPHINLSIEFNERVPSFKEENVDIIIGMSIPIEEDAIQRTIQKTSYLFCASPEFQNKHKIQSIEDLNDKPYVTHSIRYKDHIISFKNGEQLQIGPKVRVNSSESMASFVEQGMGFGMILEYVANEKIKKGSLIEILPEYRIEKPIFIQYEKRRFVAPKVQSFIDFFTEKKVFEL